MYLEGVRTSVRSTPRWRVTSTPILHRGTDRGRFGCGSSVRSKAVRRYDDPVEVRKGADEDPDQFLWRGRLWQVREVVAHWVETGAWWARRPAAAAADQAGPGRGGSGHRPPARARGVAGGSSQGKGRCRSSRRSTTPASGSSTWSSAGPRAAGSSSGRWTEGARDETEMTQQHERPRLPAGGDPLLPASGPRSRCARRSPAAACRSATPMPTSPRCGRPRRCWRRVPSRRCRVDDGPRRTPGCCSPRWPRSSASGRPSSPPEPASGRRRRSGSRRAVTEREADDLVRDADRFLALVEASLGLTEHLPFRVA